MFEKNDRVLLLARVIITVVTCLFAIGFLVLGIVLTIALGEIYILIILFGWIICFLIWLFTRLYMSHIVDVKLIRNKLYGEENIALGAFIGIDNVINETDLTEGGKVQTELTEQQEQLLAELKVVYSEGAISREQYEQSKKEILENK